MKATLWLTLALSFFSRFGNGQDGAVSTTPPPDGWGVHGNVAWSKAQHEAELEKAAAAARQKKALMGAMSSYVQQPAPITSAEQYLAVHRPPAPPAGESAAPSPVRRDAYVPEFEAAPARSGRGRESLSAPVAAPSAPAPEKRGLFGLFKSKEKAPAISDPGPDPGTMESVPPTAAYPEPSSVAAAPPQTPAPVDPAALAAATQGAPVSEKPSFLGRLFGGKRQETQPSSVPQPTLSAPEAGPVPADSAAPVPPASAGATGIPAPPSFDGGGN